MVLQGKSITDAIRTRHLLNPQTPIGVRGIIGKDVTVQENAQDRFLTVTATTDDIDEDGEIILPDGADTEYFFQNRQVTVDHSLSTRDVVGSLHSANLKPNGWVLRIRMYKLASSLFADDILTIAREVGIGVSIGFVPTVYGPPTPQELAKYGKTGKTITNVIRKWKWVELSIAAFPCNVNCRSLNTSANKGKMAALNELVTKGRIQPQSAKALGWSSLGTNVSMVVPKRRIIVVDSGSPLASEHPAPIARRNKP
jgi:hypothetical protein